MVKSHDHSTGDTLSWHNYIVRSWITHNADPSLNYCCILNSEPQLKESFPLEQFLLGNSGLCRHHHHHHHTHTRTHISILCSCGSRWALFSQTNFHRQIWRRTSSTFLVSQLVVCRRWRGLNFLLEMMQSTSLVLWLSWCLKSEKIQ